MKDLGFSKHIWFYLIHKKKGIVEIPNPIGWREGNKSRERNDSHSIDIVISDSLEYYGLALEIIDDIRLNFGVEEDLQLLCEVRDSNNPSKRKVAYSGFLDLSTFEEKEGLGKVKFSKGTLEKIINASKSQKIELEREETLVGTVAEPLVTKDINVLGRTIFLKSKLREAIDPDSSENPQEQIPYSYRVENHRIGLNYSVTTKLSYPLFVKYSSHEGDPSDTTSDFTGGSFNYFQSGDLYTTPLENAVFFNNSENDKTLYIDFDLNFQIENIASLNFDVDNFKAVIRVHSLESTSIDDYNGSETVLVSRFYYDSGYNTIINVGNSLNNFVVKKDERISIHIEFNSQSVLDENNEGALSRTRFTFKNSSITIKENNTTDSEIRKTITAYDYGQKLIELITGNKNHFHAPILKTGIWKEVTLSSGLWIRGLYGEDYGKEDSEVDNDNNKQRISASWDDFVNFCDTKLFLGVTYKTIDGIEKVCLDKTKDKYRNRTLVNLDVPTFDFSRKTISKMLYTGCIFGDEFADVSDGQELYEEIYGMSEYNTLSEWSTEFNKTENIYKKISKYRSDATGKTLALKKGVENHPNTDTRFDSSIFIFHVKDIDAEVLEERTWHDDFIEAPTGVYSPDDATNLLFTPKQMMLRHSLLFNTELKKPLKYLSSKGNSSLSTKDLNGVVVTENALNTPISETERQRFYAEEISFSCEYDEKIINQIEGQTTVGGEEVLNVHGMIRFKNKKNEYQYGYLNKLEEKEVLKFTVISINPFIKK